MDRNSYRPSFNASTYADAVAIAQIAWQSPGQYNGASHDNYNWAGLLKSKNFMGDWRDREYNPQGNTVYVRTAVVNASEAFILWDVTALMEKWRAGKHAILKTWVDGRLAFEESDIRFRDVDTRKIEQLWMNVHHGGTKPSPLDPHLFLDPVAIPKKSIGPMIRGT